MSQAKNRRIKKLAQQYLSLLPCSVVNSIIAITVFIALYSSVNEEYLWICSWNIFLSPLLFLLVVRLLHWAFNEKIKNNRSIIKIFLITSLLMWSTFFMMPSVTLMFFVYILPFTILTFLLFFWQKWLKIDEKMTIKTIFKDCFVLFFVAIFVALTSAIYWHFYPNNSDGGSGMMLLLVLLSSLVPVAILLFIYRVVFYVLSKNLSRIHLLIIGIPSIVMMVFIAYVIDFLNLSNQIIYPIWRIILGVVLVGSYLVLVHLVKKLSHK